MSAIIPDLPARQTDVLDGHAADDSIEKVVPDLEKSQDVAELNDDKLVLLSDGGLWAWLTVFGSYAHHKLFKAM